MICKIHRLCVQASNSMFQPCLPSIALTKLDILDVFSEIKVGLAYKVDNQTIPHFPGELLSVDFPANRERKILIHDQIG